LGMRLFLFLSLLASAWGLEAKEACTEEAALLQVEQQVEQALDSSRRSRRSSGSRRSSQDGRRRRQKDGRRRRRKSHSIKRHFENAGLYYDLRTYSERGIVFYPYAFSKTLKHDVKTGFATKADVDLVLAAEKDPTSQKLAAIKLAPSPPRERKLEGLTNSRNRNDIGFNPEKAIFPHFYPIDSKRAAFEMCEVYAQALLRDVPFYRYSQDPRVAMVLRELNKFPSKTSAPTENGYITARTLFRGPNPGETHGPYVSQFLYKRFLYGNMDMEQKYHVEKDPTNMLSMEGWRAVQNGEVHESIKTEGKAYAFTGRVTGSMVHNDPLQQFYYNAALIALQNGIPEAGMGTVASTAWTTAGPPDVFASVSHVAVGALRVAWWQKFGMGMRIRPEVFAQRYELARKHDDLLDQRHGVPGLAQLKANIEVASSLIEAVLSDNEDRTGTRTALLAGQFPEGSPTHPSLPAGHAVVAGACVTVLKAMLKTFEDDDCTVETKWVADGRTAEHSIDGNSLVKYAEADASKMTVNGELNKLASNVALSRDFAGVHYRADGDGGILAGEDYAISYLKDKMKVYREAHPYDLFDGWVLQKFDGTVVMITQNGAKGIRTGTRSSPTPMYHERRRRRRRTRRRLHGDHGDDSDDSGNDESDDED